MLSVFLLVVSPRVVSGVLPSRRTDYDSSSYFIYRGGMISAARAANAILDPNAA